MHQFYQREMLTRSILSLQTHHLTQQLAVTFAAKAMQRNNAVPPTQCNLPQRLPRKQCNEAMQFAAMSPHFCSGFGGSSFIALEGAVFTSQGNYIYFFCFGFLSMVRSCALFCAYISCGSSAQFFLTIWRDLYIFPTYYVLGGSVEVSILASILYLAVSRQSPIYHHHDLTVSTISPPPRSFHLEGNFCPRCLFFCFCSTSTTKTNKSTITLFTLFIVYMK